MNKITRTLCIMLAVLSLVACGNVSKITVSNMEMAIAELPIAKSMLFTADLSPHERNLVADAVSYAEMLIVRYRSSQEVETVIARAHLNELSHKYYVIYAVVTRHWGLMPVEEQTKLIVHDDNVRRVYTELSNKLEGFGNIGINESESMMSLVLGVLHLIEMLGIEYKQATN